MNSKIEVTSKKYSLNVKDYIRGLVIAMGTAALVFVQAAVLTGEIDMSHVFISAGSAGAVYLFKNFLQPAQIKKDITPGEVDALDAMDKAAK